ncbi:hypothetical protein D6850_16940 [Roseovarius spongiae]|uniref:Uncharacterized protein n=1 Tax=Roseovarius spongiae TaxID=2320272 RepID=A0A3A8ARJ4_9RHOB|nr:hypothetical protein [Roseovarius spongiae]RKF12646.1 hypothetical protein D6850_16940 [Roseovarius spongiae]
MSDKKDPEHAARLREDIDSGKAGDKVGFPDPAAAPLGTDAEAGGATPGSEEVRTARRHEVDARPDSAESAQGPRPVSAGGSGSRRGAWMAVAAVVALALLALILVWVIVS